MRGAATCPLPGTSPSSELPKGDQCQHLPPHGFAQQWGASPTENTSLMSHHPTQLHMPKSTPWSGRDAQLRLFPPL